MTDSVTRIIERCTRGGRVAWSQVARQLGQSVETVRARHDPTYQRQHEAKFR